MSIPNNFMFSVRFMTFYNEENSIRAMELYVCTRGSMVNKSDGTRDSDFCLLNKDLPTSLALCYWKQICVSPPCLIVASLLL